MLNMILDGGVTAPRDLIGVVTTPVATFGTWVKNGVTDFFSTFSEYDSLKKENEQLIKRITELETGIAGTYSDKVEIDRLRGMLNVIDPSPELQFITADVVMTAADGFGSTFNINKGTMDGIELNSVAVAAGGLVGKVTAVGLNWAIVTAITDPSMSVGATIPRSEATGVTESTIQLRLQGQCRIAYLSADDSVVRGDQVYTSGLGGVFPAGILIGTVSKIEYEENGLAQNATVDIAADLKGLRRLYITNGAWTGE